MVCRYRPDIENANMFVTEILILSYIDWRVQAIADEDNIKMLVDHCHGQRDAAFLRYSKCFQMPTDGECSPEECSDAEY